MGLLHTGILNSIDNVKIVAASASGDNPFFGVDHLFQDRAREKASQCYGSE